jgi:hypothetical protein
MKSIHISPIAVVDSSNQLLSFRCIKHLSLPQIRSLIIHLSAAECGITRKTHHLRFTPSLIRVSLSALPSHPSLQSLSSLPPIHVASPLPSLVAKLSRHLHHTSALATPLHPIAFPSLPKKSLSSGREHTYLLPRNLLKVHPQLIRQLLILRSILVGIHCVATLLADEFLNRVDRYHGISQHMCEVAAKGRNEV